MSWSQEARIPLPMSPGLDPPPGIDPYFTDPFTLRPYMELEVAACVGLTTVLLVGRLYTKVALMKRVSWEDFFAVLGWLAFIVTMALNLTAGNHGAGTHQWNLHYQDVRFIRRIKNYTDMVYSISLCATKLSLMLLIRRVFCSTRYDIPYIITVCLIFLNTGFYLCYIIVPAAECSPREKIWMPEVPGKCVDVKQLYLASAIFNFLSDIAMLSVPVFLIWRLQMSIRRKIGTIGIFCTGGLACIASLLRMIWTIFLIRTDDYSYAQFGVDMWSTAEIAFGLVCSCLVVLPRLYQHLCVITPSASTVNKNDLNAKTESERANQYSHGKNKREWMQLEERATRDQKVFAERARLGDEEAVDKAID